MELTLRFNDYFRTGNPNDNGNFWKFIGKCQCNRQQRLRSEQRTNLFSNGSSGSVHSGTGKSNSQWFTLPGTNRNNFCRSPGFRSHNLHLDASFRIHHYIRFRDECYYGKFISQRTIGLCIGNCHQLGGTMHQCKFNLAAGNSEQHPCCAGKHKRNNTYMCLYNRQCLLYFSSQRSQFIYLECTCIHRHDCCGTGNYIHIGYCCLIIGNRKYYGSCN